MRHACRRRSIALLLLASICLVTPACGPRRTPTAAVTGEVRFAGNPVEAATVTFLPAGGRPAYGVTDASGRFTIRTWTEADGAIEGEHVVCVTKQVPDPQAKPGDAFMGVKNLLPDRYATAATSPLRATVKRGGANEFRFDLE